jgi:hypothetical protein
MHIVTIEAIGDELVKIAEEAAPAKPWSTGKKLLAGGAALGTAALGAYGGKKLIGKVAPNLGSKVRAAAGSVKQTAKNIKHNVGVKYREFKTNRNLNNLRKKGVHQVNHEHTPAT